MTRLAGLLLLPLSAAVQAQEAPPAVFTRVTACRTVQDGAQRLACFDREVAALAQAQAARDVLVVDREQVRRTRRSLFGLALPDVGRLFGDGGEDEINSRVVAARTDRFGWATIQIEGGAVWVQTDGRPLRPPPRPGQPIRIRRAALGSYLANVNNQVAIRVRRVQ